MSSTHSQDVSVVINEVADGRWSLLLPGHGLGTPRRPVSQLS